jgi:hypothetical protein
MHANLKSLCLKMLLIGSLFLSCTTSPEKPYVARVNDSYLYLSDLSELYNDKKFSSAEDSSALANAFIMQWVRNEVLANKAQQNLTEDEKNVESLIEEYRNSLLIYRYQEKLLQERLDTIVSESEMLDYFNQHQDNFQLNRNIVRLIFVKIAKEKKSLRKIQRLLKENNLDDRQELLSNCMMEAEKYYLDDEVWLEFDEVKKELPLQSYHDEHFLKNNKNLQVNEGDFVYLINIIDYRTQNSASVFDFERDKIRNLILQKRKNELLQKMQNDLLKDAELSNSIEIMNK